MKSSSKLLQIILVLTFFGIQNSAVAQQFNQMFDTKNHPKAKGVWAQVKYPDGWAAKEVQGPSTLQMFTGPHDGVNVQLQLLIRDFGVDIENECANNISEAEWNQSMSDRASNTVGTNSKKVKVDGKPGFTSDVTRPTQVADVKMSFAAKQLHICHKKTRILLSCGNTILEENIQKASQNLTKIESICKNYFTSFVLKEK